MAASAQVVETSAAKNSPSHVSTQPGDLFQSSYLTNLNQDGEEIAIVRNNNPWGVRAEKSSRRANREGKYKECKWVCDVNDATVVIHVGVPKKEMLATLFLRK